MHILFHRECIAFDVLFNGGSFAHLVVYYLRGQEVWFLNLLYTKFCKRRSLTSKRIYIPGNLCVCCFHFGCLCVIHHSLLPDVCAIHLSQTGPSPPMFTPMFWVFTAQKSKQICGSHSTWPLKSCKFVDCLSIPHPTPFLHEFSFFQTKL